MTKSTITREQITSWMNDANYTLEEPLNADDAAAARAILAMGHELLAAMDSEPAIADCDPEVYDKGVSVCLVAIPKETAEVICQNITAATGCKVDWHYFGGRVHIKALRVTSQPAPVVPEEATPDRIEILASARRRDHAVFQWDEDQRNAAADSWNACRAVMLEQQLVDRVDEKSLTSINHAPDLVSLQKKAESIIGNSPGIPDCWCCTCRPVVLNDMRFVVCPDCGNKRCPRANDHRNACTGSNEPGQEGSAYPDTPREVKP